MRCLLVVAVIGMGAAACGADPTSRNGAAEPASSPAAEPAPTSRAAPRPPAAAPLAIPAGDEPFAGGLGELLVWSEYQQAYGKMVAFIEALDGSARATTDCDAMAGDMQLLMDDNRAIVARVRELRPMIAPGRRQRVDDAYNSRVVTSSNAMSTAIMETCPDHARMRAVMQSSPL